MNSPALTPNDVTALLSTGQLPELGAQIMAEAARRWSVEPSSTYSQEAQRVKMEKAEAKRARRTAKQRTKSMDNEEIYGDSLPNLDGLVLPNA